MVLGYREVTMDADAAVLARDRELPRGYCPRCRREAVLLTLEQAGRLSHDTMRGHIVILSSGDARVCFGWPDAAR